MRRSDQKDDANWCFGMSICGTCRYDLHVLMVEHGKRCPRCASNGKPRKESHGDCPLVNLKELAAKLKAQDV